MLYISQSLFLFIFGRGFNSNFASHLESVDQTYCERRQSLLFPWYLNKKVTMLDVKNKSFVPNFQVLFWILKFCSEFKSFVPKLQVLFRIYKFCSEFTSFVPNLEALFRIFKFCSELQFFP